MAEEAQQQLQLVQTELSQVQDQISTLAELEKSLLQQQDELRSLLDFYRDSNDDDGKGVKAAVSGSKKEDWSGSFEWDERANDLLKNVFGLSAYRTNQREIMNAIMSGRDVVVIMAAGGGKSLCYQLPALLRPGIALVVSPLLSLIEDQVMGLLALDITAGMLTSSTSKEEEKAIFLSLEKGVGDLRVLYVTPEKIAKSKRFMSKLEKCNKAGRLSLMAIDEAHCCSQWGHDFRPDYKNLGMLKTQFPKVPIIALTATATERVQTDLKEMLHLTYCERFVSSINRPNLFYEIRYKQTKPSEVIDDIAEYIKQEYTKKESGIVYCFTRRECEQLCRVLEWHNAGCVLKHLKLDYRRDLLAHVADELKKRKISAAYYHAYMEPEEKSRVHTRWSTNKIQIIVGTVAFGMGINKPDVRFVIHHSISKSLETYYQESGRAGRDGLPAQCLLFFRPADLARQSSMVFAEYAGIPNLYSIARYCQSKRNCRRVAFFRHFGEPQQDCSGMCDNCAYSKEVIDMDVTAHAKSLITHVKELSNAGHKYTMLQLVDSWKSRSRQIGENLVLIKELSKEDVENLIIHLLLEGLLKEEWQHTAYATNAYVALGACYRAFIQGQSQRKIKLEVVQGVKSNIKKQSRGPGAADANLQSGMAQMLDSLRQQLAGSHGSIFPHSVLSSQHITMLCDRRPQSLDQVAEVIGKTKAEHYGPDILQAIEQHLKQNPDGSEEQSGPWMSPKGACTALPLSDVQTPKPTLSRLAPKRTTDKMTIPFENKTGQLQGSTFIISPDLVPESCINLDTESEDDKVQLEKNKDTDEAASNKKAKTKDSDDDNDEDFVLVRRIKRKR